MRDRSRESGQSAVLVMFAMLGLLGFTGLGVDVGMLFHAKRNLQTAADSAAVAGAIEASYTDMTYDAAGKAASALDGYTNGVNGVTVLMNNPPQSGPHTTDARYVEAIVSQPQSTFFMRVFGFSSVNVRARAVAYRGAASTNCMYILDPNNDPATLQLQGSFTVNAPNCGIVVNSPNGGALQYTGSGGSLTAGSVGVVEVAQGNAVPTPPPQRSRA